LSQIDQFRTTIDKKLDSLGERVEPAQQGDAWRLEGGPQRSFGGSTLVRPRRVSHRAAAAIDFGAIDIEFRREQLEKPLAPIRVEQQIGAAEISGASARGDLAAPPVEAAQHLVAKSIGVVPGGVGPGRTGQHTTRRLGDLAPSAPQVGQGPIEDAFEKTGRNGIGHGASDRLGRPGRDARTQPPSILKEFSAMIRSGAQPAVAGPAREAP